MSIELDRVFPSRGGVCRLSAAKRLHPSAVPGVSDTMLAKRCQQIVERLRELDEKFRQPRQPDTSTIRSLVGTAVQHCYDPEKLSPYHVVKITARWLCTNRSEDERIDVANAAYSFFSMYCKCYSQERGRVGDEKINMEKEKCEKLDRNAMLLFEYKVKSDLAPHERTCATCDANNLTQKYKRLRSAVGKLKKHLDDEFATIVQLVVDPNDKGKPRSEIPAFANIFNHITALETKISKTYVKFYSASQDAKRKFYESIDRPLPPSPKRARVAADTYGGRNEGMSAGSRHAMDEPDETPVIDSTATTPVLDGDETPTLPEESDEGWGKHDAPTPASDLAQMASHALPTYRPTGQTLYRVQSLALACDDKLHSIIASKKGERGLPGSSQSWNRGKFILYKLKRDDEAGFFFQYRYTNRARDVVGYKDECKQWTSCCNRSCKVHLHVYDGDGSAVSKSEGDIHTYTKQWSYANVSPDAHGQHVLPENSFVFSHDNEPAFVFVCCNPVDRLRLKPNRQFDILPDEFPYLQYQFNADKVVLLPSTQWGDDVTMVRMVFDASPVNDKASDIWLSGAMPYELVLECEVLKDDTAEMFRDWA